MLYKLEQIYTDILIIGAGAAGCYAAIKGSEYKDLSITLVDKANIKRSGCLAAGVNAINAYIGKEETIDGFVKYVKDEFDDIIREDLVYTIAEGLNRATKDIEDMGLTILKDKDDKYIERGKRSIKINGENIKPLLARKVQEKSNIQIINNLNIIDYILKDNKVIGAYGISERLDKIYFISAKATICCTGGASGIYKPNNPGFSKHKMWYSPFNTGAGYAMGIRAGAEMTTMEMRFIALRCKDTIAPTGTIAQGIKAKQINVKGEEYVKKYGKPTTINRLYATIREKELGNYPCYLNTKGISEEQSNDLIKAYLNMAPSQVLRWIENDTLPSYENVELETTEPYIVGGHCGSGYWIDINRKTTLNGLYAAGDVAGGSPKKYVTGCFVEGKIAVQSAIKNIRNKENEKISEEYIKNIVNLENSFLENKQGFYTINQIEEAMQKVMDEYAGGISKNYKYTEESLEIANLKIMNLLNISQKLKAENYNQINKIHEVIDRLYVSIILIAHLKARKETRWHCYAENVSYPYVDNDNYKKYINSIYKNGNVEIIFRDLIERDE